MTSAKTPAEHAADLRARATSLLTGDIPRAHARAAIVAELATEILRSAVPALVGQLRAGALAQNYDAAIKRAGDIDLAVGAEASSVPPEVRAVFVLLRAQIDRTAKWLAGDGTEHAMTAVRLEGEARGLISAADAIDPPTPADAPTPASAPPAEPAPAGAPAEPPTGEQGDT